MMGGTVCWAVTIWTSWLQGCEQRAHALCAVQS
mgnify:CR=1 FL=1